MGLSRAVSEIDGDFCRKSQNFPTSLYFAPPLKGFPLEFGIGADSRKTRGTTNGPIKKFDDIFSRLDTIHQRDRRTDRLTDGRADTGPQQRPLLLIASRGKNPKSSHKDRLFCRRQQIWNFALESLLIFSWWCSR